ncbi:MAG: hypothetical protein KatS3mg091_825 [Patescibacteria group bacterium]|nr:MAG: hypothetical protein KatS3mg091_825 [Patescibacteria group bacterium]
MTKNKNNKFTNPIATAKRVFSNCFSFFKNLLNNHLLELLSLLLFIFTAYYVNYPDEYVNLLAGKAILNGQVAYKDFFDHHMPLAWFLAAVIMILSENSLLLFKFVWAILQFGFLWFVIGKLIKKYSDEIYSKFKYFAVLYPVVAMYFWLHLFLADSIASLTAASSLWLLIALSFAKTIEKKDICITGLLLSSIVLTSLTYIYWTAFAYLWLFLIFVKTKPCLRCYLKFTLINLMPYLVLGLYILITNSFSEFIFANFTYNTEFYINIANYTKGRYFNPVKMLLTLIFNFWDKTLPVIPKIGNHDLYFPHTQLFILSALLTTYLIFKLNKAYGVLFFLMLSLSAPRSEIISLGDRNYQAGVFITTSLASLFVSFYLYRKTITKDLETTVIKALMVINIIYATVSVLFFSQSFYEKVFFVYTQKMPRNYDRDFTAEFIDSLLDKNDYFWIGPYEPHRAFFVVKGRLPGKYPTLLPQFSESDYLQSNFIKQFETNPPKIILFKHTSSIFMTPAEQFGEFFLTYLNQNYIRVSDADYKVVRNLTDFDLNTDLYINKNYADEIITKLKQKGYIDN